MKQKTLFMVSAVALLSLFIVGALVYKKTQTQETVAQVQSNQQALVRMHSPAIGKQDAPVVLVEFFDPACESCAAFYPFVKSLMAKNPDQIRLVLRYAPLHQGSDKVIAALEAARKQGLYWPALEILLDTQEEWAQNHVADVERVFPHWASLGLDMVQLKEDMNSQGVASIIAQDIADAKALYVNKTPSFFVNGQPLTSFGYQQLETMIDRAIAEAKK
ncbi:thioredoxin domain-containing protein [Chitinibacter bivalviorum]|uniref:Thioredoxin domain-containing protein n=1 Tax=Chitinibacter bivalviorum TaxID=2739434 RepID=A0A7H9BLJ2_9NEIS|nr:thioredoxin domain-containing protein [Chitinibacter bivalviorum]QLG89547.1 thioredoxin domain-containing protein [Chitinibacter bivalviorum]